MIDGMQTRLKIVHETIYQFSGEVFIEPHYLRFKPRTTPYNLLESSNFQIFPVPIDLSEQSDAESNLIHFCRFDGFHVGLNIRSESVVMLRENNPFEFNLFPESSYDWPLYYPILSQDILFAALSSQSVSNSLMEYGRNILAASFNRTLDFLVNLTSRIHVDFTAETRLQGEPYSPDTTFRLRKGSCRDLAWMQIQLVRNFGIAARFVSGYYYNHLLNNSFELHAWVEVYLPGAGWVGFDPSNGILAVSTHIPICSSAHYQNTLPVIGSFRGGASSTMDVSLSIEKI